MNMKIFYDLDEFAKTGYHTSVALGFFDGVHLGHMAVIESAVKQKEDALAAVMTFSQPPAFVLTGRSPALLSTNEQKARLFELIGADVVIFADFAALKHLSAEDFVGGILKKKLKAEKVFCGFNYHFGACGKADSNDLARLCREHGIKAQACQPVLSRGEPVSSSRIRERIVCGDMKEAAALLGRPFSIEGEIRRGNHIGTALGYPTLNLPLDDDSVLPLFGVYESKVTIRGRSYRGATNIGVHPTVKQSSAPLCETFLLGFEEQPLYGEKVVCELVRFIRAERKFSSLEELKNQVKNDIETISRTAI